MKLSSISIAIALAGFVGAAAAGQAGETLPPVNVAGVSIAQCVPPNDHTGHACDAFNQLVRANFSRREIGMLFGYQTSYPENLTGGIARLQKRYQALMQEYVAAHATATGKIAAK